jgi:hypothetical protein
MALTGAHFLFYSAEPEADRAFFRDVLNLHSVDAGGGWLIFALPPAEAAFHPIEGGAPSESSRGGAELMRAVLYLMCDDLGTELTSLKQRGVHSSEVSEAPWGIKTTIRLPSGGELGLYQARHPTAV